MGSELENKKSGSSCDIHDDYHNFKEKVSEKNNNINIQLNKFDLTIQNMENTFNNTIKNMEHNLDLMNKALVKLNEHQERFLQHKQDVSKMEFDFKLKIQELDNKISNNTKEILDISDSKKWLIRLVSSLLIAILIKSVYDVKANNDIQAKFIQYPFSTKEDKPKEK